MKLSIENQLITELIQLNGILQKKLGGTLSIHGLGLSEFLTLRKLYDAPTQKMRRVDLAESIGLSASGITRLLNPMEKIGLVKKEENPRDARVSLVSLTEAGERTVKEVEVSFEDATKSLLNALEADEKQSFLRLVKKLT